MVSFLSSFFKPQSFDTYCYYDKEGWCYMMEFTKPLPRVVLIADKLLRQWNPEMPSLEELGYVEYDRSFSMRATYYARRPWVWLLKARIRITQKSWPNSG